MRACLFVAALLCALPLWGAPSFPEGEGGISRKHPFTFEDMMALKRVEEPEVSPALKSLAYLLADQGKISEAREHYQTAIKLQPSDRLRVVAGSMLPPICRSMEEIHRCRAELSRELTRLYDDELRDSSSSTDAAAVCSAYRV